MRVFFVNDTATTEIYTLSLHDALPISLGYGGRLQDLRRVLPRSRPPGPGAGSGTRGGRRRPRLSSRSEEHTSELQSRQYLVCRLLLEKKRVTRTVHKLQDYARQPRTEQ